MRELINTWIGVKINKLVRQVGWCITHYPLYTYAYTRLLKPKIPCKRTTIPSTYISRNYRTEDAGSQYTSTSKDLLTSSWSLMRSSSRTEREDGRERVGQPQHNPNLHLSSLRDPTDRIAPPALVHLWPPAPFHIWIYFPFLDDWNGAVRFEGCSVTLQVCFALLFWKRDRGVWTLYRGGGLQTAPLVPPNYFSSPTAS